MRNEFFRLLKEEMRRDESVFLIAADMGLGLVESIQQEFPKRFLNIGISEQNAIGIASGLCNTGFRPFCYSISNFITERCFEQVRNDVCLHKYPVTIVGTSTGFDNGPLGPTHHIIDDIGCMKVLPGMNIYSPGSVGAVSHIFQDITKHRGPAYVRIGKSSYKAPVADTGLDYLAKTAQESKALVITHGSMLENCVKAYEMSSAFSIYCINRIKPLGGESLDELLARFTKVIVVEDHFASSGLYNSICQYVAEKRIGNAKLYSLGVPEAYEEIVGTSDYFAEKFGISPAKIAQFIAGL